MASFNLTKAELIEFAMREESCSLSQSGALITQTGSHTGRAANCRFIVEDEVSNEGVDWGLVNKKFDSSKAERVFAQISKNLESMDRSYEADAFVGSLPVTLHSTSAWHTLFFKNMFRTKPSRVPLDKFEGRKIKIYHTPWKSCEDLGIDNESKTLILLDLKNMRVAIMGTAYAGEIKKSAFTLCNYFMPEIGVFPMHASANCADDGSNSCVFFGLSGTGKTTLSSSESRSLIGDDEIMWSQQGLSNLEGGCYAKLVDLDSEKEPEIFKAVNRFASIQENVQFYEDNRRVNYMDRTLTENTRGSYALEALSNVFPQGRESEPPKTVIFLTADAFGALPAVARLNSAQAQYHFVSGYTAKVAGTEMGIKEPVAAFSACFGSPFMPRASASYAAQLAAKMEEYGVSVWLLNTGWTQGGYGKGPRFPLSVSRKLLRAIQSGELAQMKMQKHSRFGFEVPTHCPGIDDHWLEIPEGKQVDHLVGLFQENEAKNLSSLAPEILKEGAPK